jgi:murein DD-endopeptidase MepM/ murein hydrolase activator NlpD
MRTRTGSLSLLLVRDNGRSSFELELPGWTHLGMRSVAMFALCCAAFVGWELQALWELRGSRADYALEESAARWALFQHAAPHTDGPSRDEILRRVALARANDLGLGDRRAASLLWAGTPEQRWVNDAGRVGTARGTLLWPVREGMYGRGYGSGMGGYHLAVDIQGPRGSDVLAAADGTVGYAGNELRGYGNLVILVHAGGWVTLYGHNQKFLVTPGEHVRQGEAIAELGSSGRSMGPHVHFELVHDGRNCDPVPLFRFGDASLPENWPTVALSRWLPSESRPHNVRCGLRRKHPSAVKGDSALAPEDEGGDSDPGVFGDPDALGMKAAPAPRAADPTQI